MVAEFTLGCVSALHLFVLSVGEADTYNVLGNNKFMYSFDWNIPGTETFRRFWDGLKDWIKIDLRGAGCKNVNWFREFN
jgi:hypothetical protein